MKTLTRLTLLVLVVALLVSCAGKETAVPPTATVAQAEPTKAVAEPTKEPAPELGEAPEDENNIYATIADYEAATGNSIGSFGESPMLADMVKSGDLPAVKERLPNEPAVVRPKVIGQYGGEIRLIGFYEGAGAFSGFTENMGQGLFVLHESVQDPPTFHPNVAKDWELAEDGMSITIYLREGMKWSDGDDYNANDFAFGYEVLQDSELTIEISSAWMPGGELMGLNVIDDYTVQYTFAVPYYRAIEVFAGGPPIYPEHFLKQYIPKYNDGAEALAKEEGFESWQAAADFHGGINDSNYDRDPTAPQINPWIIKEISPESILWERNPYFWRVDAAGNQLPYVDTLLVINATDASAITPLKVMAGEVDWNDYIGLSLADYPALKEKEAEGAYNAYLYPKTEESHAMGFALNFIHPDPVLREIFNDIRFRQALSLAINRDEISENLFYGLSEPWTAPVSAIWTGYEDWMGTYYAEHDVEQANALLDEMGLEWDDAHEYRLRPDGEELFFPGEYCTEWLAYSEDLMDLVALHWKDIGVHMEPKFVPEDILQTAYVANETSWGASNSDGGSEMTARADYPMRLIPPWHWGWADCCPMSSYQWRVWLDCERDTTCNQEDVDGIEPPDEIKLAYQLAFEWLDTPAGTPEYKQKINELIKLNVENFWYFGTVTPPPGINIRSHRLGNAEGEGGPNAGLHHYFGEAYFINE
jgi:peptide/nickel transport system substrate-binding protein